MSKAVASGFKIRGPGFNEFCEVLGLGVRGLVNSEV